MDIAVIGLGACGVNVLRHLINHKNTLQYKKIYIIQDIDRQLATGLPYQYDHDSLLLNVYPQFMSLNDEDKEEFSKFLKDKGVDFDPYDFLPRRLFGEYIQSIYNELDHSNIELIHQHVTAIEILGENNYLIRLANGKKIIVDSVQLTMGHMAYNDPYDLIGKENYFHNPYPIQDKLLEVRDSDKVAIIGAGLSAIDILMYLKKDDPSRPVDMFSLEGFAKSVRGKNYQDNIQLKYVSAEALATFANKLGRELTTDDLMAEFKKEAHHHGVNFDYFWYERPEASVETLKLDLKEMDQLNTLQTLIIAFKADLNPTWDRLSNDEREKFFKDHNSRLSLYGAPIPTNRAKEIIDFVSEGSLGIYANSQEIKQNEEGLFTVITDEDSYTGYDYIINATGQSTKIDSNFKNQAPLIKQMIIEGLAEADPFGGFKLDYPTYSLMHPELGQLDTFKVYGQLASGTDLFNNSIAKLRRSTRMGVEALADYFKK